MKKSEVIIYTDGACSGNPGPGGWGALLRYQEQEKELSGGEPHTTNNRMEMQAVISALIEVGKAEHIKLYSDSQYLLKGITEWLPGWKRKNWKTAQGKPVKNKDLWQKVDDLQQSLNVDWIWVKGHSGNAKNEAVDALARAAVGLGS